MLCDACREEHPLLDREQGSLAQYIILPASNIWLCDPIQSVVDLFKAPNGFKRVI
ncbi:MAG: hypothetical protein V7640_3226 [Betaproteobacteria bacterium]|jgi:hypothetical protein